MSDRELGAVVGLKLTPATAPTTVDVERIIEGLRKAGMTVS